MAVRVSRTRLGFRSAMGGLTAATAAALVVVGVSSAAATVPTCATVAPSVIQSELGVQVQPSPFNTLLKARDVQGSTSRSCIYVVTASRKLGPSFDGVASLTYTSSVSIRYISPATGSAWRTLITSIEDPSTAACTLAGLDCAKKGHALKPLTGIGTSAYWTQEGRQSSDVSTDLWVFVPGAAMIELSVPGKSLQHAEALAETIAGLV